VCSCARVSHKVCLTAEPHLAPALCSKVSPHNYQYNLTTQASVFDICLCTLTSLRAK